MTNPQLPPLPIDPQQLAGIDRNRPLNHHQAGLMIMAYANLLAAVFNDPRAELIDTHLERNDTDGLPGFTFTCKLRAPQPHTATVIDADTQPSAGAQP